MSFFKTYFLHFICNIFAFCVQHYNHQLCRKEKTNTELLEKIIVNNFGSNEFFINKAIGWSLRDYSKTNPKWVKEFVGKYKDKMDKLSIKEASKYI